MMSQKPITAAEYMDLAGRTVSPYFQPEKVPRGPLYAIIGLAGEAGELLDHVKSAIFYGDNAKFDPIQCDEEIGDCLWWISEYLRWRGISFEEVMRANIEKLKVRFPNAFTSDAALHRNPAAERTALEQALPGNPPLSSM